MASKVQAVAAGEKVEPPQVQILTGMKAQTPASRPVKAKTKSKPAR